MEEPGGLQSRGLQRVRHDWATEHVATMLTMPTKLDMLIIPILAILI